MPGGNFVTEYKLQGTTCYEILGEHVRLGSKESIMQTPD